MAFYQKVTKRPAGRGSLTGGRLHAIVFAGEIMSTRIRIVVLLVFLLALGLPQAAFAQETITLGRVVIQLWPEFDRPSMLVLIGGQVGGDTALPVELHFNLPPGAEVNAVAYGDLTSGDLLVAPHSVEGDVLTMTSVNGTFHIEFYDTSLAMDGETRSYALEWAADYPIDELVIEAQQPIGASDFEMQPGGGMQVTDQFGLPNTRVTRSAVAADEVIGVSVAYAKSDPALTADRLQPPQTGEETAPGVGGERKPLWWVTIVLVVVGAALIGGGVSWYVRATKQTAAPARQRAAGKGAARFCTNCGEPVGAGDNFCRKCGARLRGT
jgi:hypothetical protein